jgi:hypothetical protein
MLPPSLMHFKLLLSLLLPVQTVWPQSGRVSCDLLTRQIYTSSNSHRLLMFGRALVLLKLNSADLDRRIQDIERRISRLEDANNIQN